MTLYNISSGKLVPVNVDGKNNLANGTILQLHGYGDPKYVIFENQGINERFAGYGSRYSSINLSNLSIGYHDAHSLYFKNENKLGIRCEITSEVLGADELIDIVQKAKAKQTAKEENQILADIKKKEIIEKGKKLFKKYIPEDAQALIIAERHQDESDIQTDYFSHSTKDEVIIGYSKHVRDLFSELRKHADRLPETKHLGVGKGHFEARVIIGANINSNGSYYNEGQYSHWHRELEEDEHSRIRVFETKKEAEDYIAEKGEPDSISFDGKLIPFRWEITEDELEHREKYSGGSGYYLKDGHSNSSGWSICKYKYGKRSNEWSEEVYYWIGKRCIFEEGGA